jgi:Holliday junction resolvase RusA-like endonuclease
LRVSVELPFDPVAAVRPKVTRWNTYYPGAYGKWLPEVREWLSNNWHKDPLDCELSATLLFVVPRPRSHYGTGRNAGKPKPSAPRYPHPDIDNYIKAALDAMNGTVYRDDKLIIDLSARKVYGDPGHIQVTLRRADHGADPPALSQ